MFVKFPVEHVLQQGAWFFFFPCCVYTIMKQCFHLKAASIQRVTTKFTHFALAQEEFRWEGFVYFNVHKHEVHEY